MLKYGDVKPALDAAIERRETIVVELGSPGAAVVWRRKAYQFRVADRQHNLAIYPPGHPMHGGSIYDAIIIRLEEHKAFVELVSARAPVMKTLDGTPVEAPAPVQPREEASFEPTDEPLTFE